MRKKQTTERVISPRLRALADHVRALDRVIHEPARLVILSLLVRHGAMSYRDMQPKTCLRPGNLSAQAARLEAAGYLEVVKSFRGRYPATIYLLTSAGLAAWETYWSHQLALQESLKMTESRAEERP